MIEVDRNKCFRIIQLLSLCYVQTNQPRLYIWPLDPLSYFYINIYLSKYMRVPQMRALVLDELVSLLIKDLQEISLFSSLTGAPSKFQFCIENAKMKKTKT